MTFEGIYDRISYRQRNHNNDVGVAEEGKMSKYTEILTNLQEAEHEDAVKVKWFKWKLELFDKCQATQEELEHAERMVDNACDKYYEAVDVVANVVQELTSCDKAVARKMVLGDKRAVVALLEQIK